MDNSSLDELQSIYKRAVDEWVEAIRAEEALATLDHSESAMEKWDTAGFNELEAQKRAKQARDAYQEGLRRLNYNF